MKKRSSATRDKRPKAAPLPSEEKQPARRAWRRTGLAITLILLIGGAAYSNSLRGAFVLDDHPNILDSVEIRGLLPTKLTLLGPPYHSYTGRPVAMFFLALSYRIHGISATGFHVGNLFIHLAAALTVFGVIRRTLRLPRLQSRLGKDADLLSTTVAVLWVVHPLTTSAVTYISQRVESQMALFYLLTLYWFLRAATAQVRRGRIIASILTVLFCLLGMGTKEPMATAPAVLLLFDRTLIAGSFVGAIRTRWRLYLGVCATLVPLTILLSMHPHGDAVGTLTGFSSVDYLKSQAWSIVLYLKLSIWPSPLVLYYGVADYDVPVLRTFSQYVPWAAIVVPLLVSTLWGIARRSTAALLGASFFIILAPSSSVVAMPTEIIAEHRMYLPLVAVVALVVFGVHSLINPHEPDAASRWLRPTGLALCACAVTALSIATYRRNEDYRTPYAIWSDALQKRPGSPTVLGEIGRIEMEEGDFDRAALHLRESIKLCPYSIIPRMAYGRLLEKLGKIDDAIGQYRLACHYATDDVAAPHVLLAKLLFKQGQLEPAIRVLEEAARRNPSQQTVHAVLGALQIRAGRQSEMQRHFAAVIRYVPNAVFAHQMIADALSEHGMPELAIPHLEAARSLSPRDPGTALRLGLIFLTQGRIAAAAREFRGGLDTAPNEFSLLNNLAWIRATAPDASLRNGSEAVRLAERGMRALRRRSGSGLDTLAAAYAENGDFELAVKTVEQAIQLLTTQSENGVDTADLQKRLSLYQSGKPFRDQLLTPATHPSDSSL